MNNQYQTPILLIPADASHYIKHNLKEGRLGGAFSQEKHVAHWYRLAELHYRIYTVL